MIVADFMQDGTGRGWRWWWGSLRADQHMLWAPSQVLHLGQQLSSCWLLWAPASLHAPEQWVEGLGAGEDCGDETVSKIAVQLLCQPGSVVCRVVAAASEVREVLKALPHLSWVAIWEMGLYPPFVIPFCNHNPPVSWLTELNILQALQLLGYIFYNFAYHLVICIQN